jgi:hypothetical protein
MTAVPKKSVAMIVVSFIFAFCSPDLSVNGWALG